MLLLPDPPANSGIKKQAFNKIPALVGGTPRLKVSAVKWAVYSFHNKKSKAGRPKGWRKTTKAEDARILTSFRKVRQPLGSGVEFRDVHNDLPEPLRKKISRKTVGRRLAEQGYIPQEKTTADDEEGGGWRKARVAFAKRHERKSELQWVNRLQGVGDFHEATYFPRTTKTRHKVKIAARTIMRDGGRGKAVIQTPQNLQEVGVQQQGQESEGVRLDDEQR